MAKEVKYIVPNFFTSISFLLGFFSLIIVSTFYNHPDNDVTLLGKEPLLLAAWMIVWCTMLDKLDGLAAKIMNASSGFGAQFDSLADLISFGVAPCFLAYFYLKHQAPAWTQSHFPLMVISLMVYVLCCAMRLARYNSKDAQELDSYFHGIPSTFSGGFIAILVVIFHEYQIIDSSSKLIYALPLTLIILGLLMVSPIYFPKIGKKSTKKGSFFEFLLVLSGYICGFGMVLPEYLFFLLIAYAGIGISYGLLKKGVPEVEYAQEG